MSAAREASVCRVCGNPDDDSRMMCYRMMPYCCGRCEDIFKAEVAAEALGDVVAAEAEVRGLISDHPYENNGFGFCARVSGGDDWLECGKARDAHSARIEPTRLHIYVEKGGNRCRVCSGSSVLHVDPDEVG